MIISKIALKQYGSYRDEVSIDINTGMTGIIGIFDNTNLRSNGSGKTTLAESILYALYGKVSGKKLGSAVFDQIPEEDIDMYTKLWFNHNGCNYKIVRGIKKSASHLSFFRLDGDKEIEMGDKETNIRAKQKLIDDTIGMDFDMFTATVFFEQRKADKFINTESGKSQEYLDSVLHLDTLREAIKIGTSKIKTMVDGINTNKAALSEVKEKISSYKVEIDRKQIVLNDIEKYTCLVNEARDKYSEAVKKQEDANKASELSDRSKRAIESVNNIKFNISSLESEISSIREKLSIASTSIDRDTESMNIEIVTVESLSKKRDMALDYVEKNNAKIKDLIGIKVGLSQERESLNQFICNISESKCSHCNQEISEEYKKIQNNLISKRIKEIVDELDAVISETSKLESEVTSKSKEAESYNKDIITSTSSIKSLQVRISTNTNFISTASAELPLKESALDRYLGLLPKAENDAQIATAEADYASSLDIKSINDEVSRLSKSISSISLEISTCNKIIGIIEEKENVCGELESKAIEYKNNIDDAQRYLDNLEIVTRVFKSMIEQMFNTSVKLIEYYSNSLIQTVYPNFRINIFKDKTKKTEPLVFDFVCDGRSREYDRLSGGQKTVSDICLRLGFSRTLMDVSNAKINFLCLDEPFESLDEYNRELIKHILKNESNIFSQLLIISHTPDARDFDRTIKVHMNGESVSYVE